MNLRHKFGVIALIYLVSLSANLVLSCLSILVYFQTAFINYQGGMDQLDALNQIIWPVRQELERVAEHAANHKTNLDTTNARQELTSRLQSLTPAVWDEIFPNLWSDLSEVIGQYEQASMERADILAREDWWEHPALQAAAADSMNAEHVALRGIHGLLMLANNELEKQRQAGVSAAANNQAQVVRILIFNGAIGALLCVSGLLLFRKWVTQPVSDLRDATRQLSKGDFDHRIKPRTNDELGALANEVNQMASTIVSMQTRLVEQERLAAAGEMVTRLAHNIRNPLAGIRGLAEATVASSIDDPEVMDCQQRIIQTVDRFEKWLRDLQQSVSPMELKLQTVEIDALTRDVILALQPMFDRRNINVNAEIDPQVRSVQVDPLHFEQALVSLITNAVQAYRTGQTVTIKVEAVADSPDQWRISVSDEGVGISPELKEKIFLPYFTTKPDGNGVGLAMANKVVKIHGGQLEVESEVGKGSRFTARLPGRVLET